MFGQGLLVTDAGRRRREGGFVVKEGFVGALGIFERGLCEDEGRWRHTKPLVRRPCVCSHCIPSWKMRVRVRNKSLYVESQDRAVR